MNNTIQKTLLTAKLFNGFWDRWRAHGVESQVIKELRERAASLEEWSALLEEQALQHKRAAAVLEQIGRNDAAEREYRLSSLHYNLMQWIYPERTDGKAEGLCRCLETSRAADELSPVAAAYDSIWIEDGVCPGRIREPLNPVGCIVILNPFDSTKEELFTYEMDFIQGGFATVSFDGPGQGEAYTLHGLKGSAARWAAFTDAVIAYARKRFPALPIHLFGTSSGAAWTIYGSGNPLVSKAVAVSPAVVSPEVRMPDYFAERMRGLTEGDPIILPDYTCMAYRNPVYLFHGLADVMVAAEDIEEIYARLPEGSRYKAYEYEGHCCNYKLGEIRRLVMEWFQE